MSGNTQGENHRAGNGWTRAQHKAPDIAGAAFAPREAPKQRAMIKLTAHARWRMRQYGIEWAWVLAAIASPDWTAPDPRQPGVTRAFKAVPERGGKVLRVAYRPDGADLLVLSAHFDRGAKS